MATGIDWQHFATSVSKGENGTALLTFHMGNEKAYTDHRYTLQSEDLAELTNQLGQVFVDLGLKSVSLPSKKPMQ